jgi:quinoprotein glucose dehydrogenase
VLYVNASDVPWIAAMREPATLTPAALHGAVSPSGAAIYSTSCAKCHGVDRRGIDRAPSLVDVARRLPIAEIGNILQYGRGFMPSFARLSGADRRVLLVYLGYTRSAVDSLLARGIDVPPPGAAPASPYEFAGYERWRDSSGFPMVKPPWGTLSAIDLNTGEYRWRIPLGQHPKLANTATPTGTEQYGGPIVTAGGLVFIAATMDARFRAFDRRTGKLLWETTLPAPGYATPSTYAVNGRQYVVIAAGGGKLGSPSSDTYVAFTLPPR